MSTAVWVVVRRRAEANSAGDTLPLHADAPVLRNTVGADVQDGPSGARAGLRAGGAMRAVPGGHNFLLGGGAGPLGPLASYVPASKFCLEMAFDKKTIV